MSCINLSQVLECTSIHLLAKVSNYSLNLNLIHIIQLLHTYYLITVLIFYLLFWDFLIA